MNKLGFESRSAIIFGGSGFIGSHLIQLLAEKTKWDIYNFSLSDNILPLGNYNFIPCDASKKIVSNHNFKNPVIFCLAAHFKKKSKNTGDYYKINTRIAKNVCNYAREKRINEIVFLSTSECYGISEDRKDESTQPQPNTPYGISKLISEVLFETWQNETSSRKLIILRPGVVFGMRERGNLSNLFKLLNRFPLILPLRKNLIKSVIYVKDLTTIMLDMVIKQKKGVSIFNIAISPNPTLKEISDEICKITHIPKTRIAININLIIIFVIFIRLIQNITKKKIFNYNISIVKKLNTSTDIDNSNLISSDYKPQYTLKDAIDDWYVDCDKKGLF